MSETSQPRKARLQFTLRFFVGVVAFLMIAMLAGREIYFWATSSPLDAAVAAFNRTALTNEVGQHEAPLTEEEIVASIQSQLAILEVPIRSMYERIARTRRLPRGAHFDSTSANINAQGERQAVWWVNLNVMTGENSGYGLRVRKDDAPGGDKSMEVRDLSLRDKDISGKELPGLLKGYTELRRLDLSHNPLSEEALDHLHALEKLEVINLQHSGITDQGLLRLRQLSNLKEVSLYLGPGHRTTEAGRRQLRDAIPGLKVSFITH